MWVGVKRLEVIQVEGISHSILVGYIFNISGLNCSFDLCILYEMLWYLLLFEVVIILHI